MISPGWGINKKTFKPPPSTVSGVFRVAFSFLKYKAAAAAPWEHQKNGGLEPQSHGGLEDDCPFEGGNF